MSDIIVNFDELKVLLERYEFNELHMHHTWKPDHSSFNGYNHIKLQENMRNYHVNFLGWDDIAQHLTLAPDGKFITGRQFGVMPCSIKGHNSDKVLMIEMIGNFDAGHDKFEGEQKESMMQLTRYSFDRGAKLVFHNEHSTKTCPGTSIDKAQFISEVRNMPRIERNEPSSWAANDINQAIELGITDGTRLHDNCTREENIVMIMRMYKLLGGK